MKTAAQSRLVWIFLHCLLILTLTSLPATALTDDPWDELWGEWTFEHVVEGGDVEKGLLVFYRDQEENEVELRWLLGEEYEAEGKYSGIRWAPIRLEDRRLTGTVECNGLPGEPWWRRVAFDVTLAEDGTEFTGTVQTKVFSATIEDIETIRSEATWRRRPLPRVATVNVLPSDFPSFESKELEKRWQGSPPWPRINVILTGDDLPLSAWGRGLEQMVQVHDPLLSMVNASWAQDHMILKLSMAPGVKGGIKTLTLAGADVAFDLPIEAHDRVIQNPRPHAIRFWSAQGGTRPYSPSPDDVELSNSDRAAEQPLPVGDRFAFEVEFDDAPRDDVQHGELIVTRRGDVVHRQDVRAFRLAGDPRHFHSKPIRIGVTGWPEAVPQALSEDQVMVRYGDVQASVRIGVGGDLTLYAMTEAGHLPIDRVPLGRPLRAEWRPREDRETDEVVPLLVQAGGRRIQVPARWRAADGTYVSDPFVIRRSGELGQEMLASARPESAQPLFPESDRDPRYSLPPPSIARTLRGRWEVQYTDAELGVVTGWAIAESDESLRVFLRHPRLPDEVEELVATEIRWEREEVPAEGPTGLAYQQRTVHLTLEGYSPESHSTWTPDLRGAPMLTLPSGVEEVTMVAANGPERSFGLHSPLAADGARVHLRMELDQRGDLIGHWAYRANADTRRNAYGGGRTGQFSPAKDVPTLGVQRGPELWTRAVPERLSVLVLDDLEELRGDEPEQHLQFGHPGARHLLLVGDELPATSQDIFELGSVSFDGFEYTYVGREGHRVMPKDEERLRVGLKVARQEAIGRGEPLPEDVAHALVYVRVPENAESGPHSFRVNGSLVSWVLTYPTNAARATFVQGGGGSPHADLLELHVAEELFAPQTVQLRVETELELPNVVVSLELLHMRNSEVLEQRELDLGRQLTERRWYMSHAIELVPEGEPVKEPFYGAAFAVRPGDEIVARMGEDAFAALVGGETRVRIIECTYAAGGPWAEALARAAACAGVAASAADVARQEALTRSELVLGPALITNLPRITAITSMHFGTVLLVENLYKSGLIEQGEWPSVIESSISVGDHAAMLLLRDEFVLVLKEQIAALELHIGEKESERSAKLERFRRMAVDWIAFEKNGGPEWPLGGLMVADPDTSRSVPIELRDALARGEFDKESKSRDEYERRVMVEALEQHVRTLRKVHDQARQMDPQDVRGLMDLTGYGFTRIVERLLPKLVRQDDSGRWIPDVVAHSYVTSLGTLGSHVMAVEDLSELDDSFLMVAASLVALPIGPALGLKPLASWAVFDATAAGYFFIVEYPIMSRKQDQQRFAVDAFAALGRERARVANERMDPSWAVSLSIGGAVLGGAAVPVSDVLSMATKAHRTAKTVDLATLEKEGARLLRQVDEGGPEALAGLYKSQKETLSAYMVAALDESSQVSASTRANVQKSVERMRDWLAGNPAGYGSDLIPPTGRKVPSGGLDEGLPSTRPWVRDPVSGNARPALATPARDASSLQPWQLKRRTEYSRDLVRSNEIVTPTGERVARGPVLGSGAYFTVHGMGDEGAEALPLVLKVLDGAEKLEEAQLVLKDVLDAQDHLDAAGIAHLPHHNPVSDVDVPYVFQRRIGSDLPAGVIEEDLLQSVSGRSKHFTDGMLEETAESAVLDLMDDLVRHGLVWEDFKPDNFALQRLAEPGPRGPLRVAITDQDRLAPLGAVREQSQLDLILNASRQGDLNHWFPSTGGVAPAMTSSAEVMFRILERRGAIRYDPQRGWMDGWMRVKSVRDRFEAMEGFGTLEDYILDPAFKKVGCVLPRMIPCHSMIPCSVPSLMRQAA